MRLALLAVAATQGLAAQSARPNGPDAVTLAVTFDANGANLTTGHSFWLDGGSAQLNATVFRGFGATASLTGLHTGSSGSGVPVNLFIAAFGPSYTLRTHAATLFAHGLAGEADGFYGLYPQSGSPSSSASSLAVQAGGGCDFRLNRRLAVRLVEADWLRTQLPNSTTNVQNNLLLGAGLVFHLQP